MGTATASSWVKLPIPALLKCHVACRMRDCTLCSLPAEQAVCLHSAQMHMDPTPVSEVQDVMPTCSAAAQLMVLSQQLDTSLSMVVCLQSCMATSVSTQTAELYSVPRPVRLAAL